MSKGLDASKEAGKILGKQATTFLIGGGVLTWEQNGGILLVKDGKCKFAYASEGSWDFFTNADELVETLQKYV